MHMTDNTHAIKQLFNSLNKEQLRALDLLLANCDDASTVMFFRGRIEMLQQIKFDICPCGTNHNDELELMGDELNDNEATLMEEYDVEANPLYQKVHSPQGASPFRCANCGIGIASLKDRMRRPKGIDGCSGCQQESAWG